MKRVIPKGLIIIRRIDIERLKDIIKDVSGDLCMTKIICCKTSRFTVIGTVIVMYLRRRISTIDRLKLRVLR